MTDTAVNTDERRSERQPPDESRVECPECGGRVVTDSDRGERACGDCGLVLDESSIDRGPEWRVFDNEDREERTRIGAPTTNLMHDKGLSTTIGWQDKDAYGQSIPKRKRARLKRLREWDERFRTKDAQERNLKQALGEIERMASALGLPKNVRETAGIVYRRALDDDIVRGRSIEGMATAALYAAARQHGTPRPLSEFATVSRVEEIRVQRAYRNLSRELGLEIEPADPLQYVSQFASRLDASDESIRRARDILDAAKAQGAHSGKSPAGLAAAAIYAATHLTNDCLTQETVSNAAHVSMVTIRNRYQELLDIYAEDGEYV